MQIIGVVKLVYGMIKLMALLFAARGFLAYIVGRERFDDIVDRLNSVSNRLGDCVLFIAVIFVSAIPFYLTVMLLEDFSIPLLIAELISSGVLFWFLRKNY